jgi:hypothetical protein
MSHRDPGVMSNEVQTLLGTQQLTPAQQDFVVWVAQLQERALSLRNVAGMGAGSDQLRNAILATLPGVKSGNKQMALKQLDAFDNQVALLERGVPKVRGQGGVTPPPKPGGGPPKPTTSGTIRMRAPNGQESDVAADQVDHYKQLGATVIKSK